jgi:hypothetical protein
VAAGNFSSPASSPASGGSPGRQNGGQGLPDPGAPLSFYALLQLAEDASLEELRQAFRRQSKRLHPDTTSLPAAVAQESFRQLRQAYVTLLDPERRRAYDASLAAARARAGQGLRTSPGAPGSASAGAAPAGGPGMRPPQNGSPASQGGPAPMAHPAGPASSLGNPPGAANRQGNANQVNASQRNGSQGAKGPDVSGLGVDGGLPKPDSVRRTLSGGEWFALLLLGVALVFCLVLGVGLAWLRGTELVREPSWWPAQESLESSQPDPGSLAVPQPTFPQPTLPQPTLPRPTSPLSFEPSLQPSSLQAPSLP